MWLAGQVGLTSGFTQTTCSILWLGSISPFTQDKEVSNTSINPSKPAYISAKPPKNSLASFWQTAGTNNLVLLNAPQGTIIDINLSLTLDDNDDGAPAASTVSTATVGVHYYLSLDPNATHRFVPISLNTTT